MRMLLAVILLACFCPDAQKVEKKEEQRVIDIYIYETYHKDYTTTFYSWIDDNGTPVGRGGDCVVEGGVSEVCVGWLQSGAMYLENTKGLSGQTMVLITIAEPDKNWVDNGSGKPLRIFFNSMGNGRWDGKINIECPYKSTYKVRRTVNIKKEE